MRHLRAVEPYTDGGHSNSYLGDFPQAFTHLALINAVMRVIDTEG